MRARRCTLETGSTCPVASSNPGTRPGTTSTPNPAADPSTDLNGDPGSAPGAMPSPAPGADSNTAPILLPSLVPDAVPTPASDAAPDAVPIPALDPGLDAVPDGSSAGSPGPDWVDASGPGAGEPLGSAFGVLDGLAA
nr:hypothetical protein GCM10017588_54400 [Microbispora rosea subsp. aerata]